MSDQDAIDSAVHGADVGVSALGPSMDRKATGLPLIAGTGTGTGHILTAMKHHGVRRYIGHATPSVHDPRENPTLLTGLIGLIARTFLRRG
ncbi:NAD(P)H-binding protein [Streptomyces rubrogriseus]|uniref:NAD(P)H-binding protein n=1 Tax=Streptomyces rubrogriseus TaxID=194673 RepID=UPI003657F402